MLKYTVIKRKNPQDQSVKYYAQIVSPEPVTIDKVSQLIAQNCTLTRHDILACLSAFQEQMINLLQEGKSVRLGDLGSFRVTMHSLGTDLEKDFTSNNVKRLTIRFVPAAKLRKAIAIGADGVGISVVGATPPAKGDVIV